MRPENKRILRAARAWRSRVQSSGTQNLLTEAVELVAAVDAAKPAARLSPAQRDALERAVALLKDTPLPHYKLVNARDLVFQVLREAEPEQRGSEPPPEPAHRLNGVVRNAGDSRWEPTE